MRNLGWPLQRLRRSDDSGVIGVLVAVLIGGGVLLGTGALVIDVGQIYQNRAELQNGADAGALAVARQCALGSCASAGAMSTALTYANSNASALTQHTAGVMAVCGSDGLGNCSAVVGTGLTNCPADPTNGVNYVDVLTSTKLANGSTLLPPVFGQTLAGSSTYDGTNVKACAQAEWGPPSSADTIAYTVSACSWYAYTNNGAMFAEPPPYPPDSAPTSSDDHILYEHGSPNATTGGCPEDNASGADAPGNFGWTTDSGNCSVYISSSGTYGGSTGASASRDCQTAIYNDWLNKTVVYLPIYTTVTGPGSGATYTLLGFAAFVITGYHITGSFHQNDWLNSANNCKGNKFCIDGYFTHGLIPSIGDPGGTPLGANVVKLTG
ncbi:MAG TPA: TadE/TadG family type IV pilus assembly protein [Streptosporangiaceae bacterium]|jgi:Flp pilus assembly protein TadG|nr:TadE/TadG family type IV pilus assembly protein [Streptosporangiaceae bacterium]